MLILTTTIMKEAEERGNLTSLGAEIAQGCHLQPLGRHRAPMCVAVHVAVGEARAILGEADKGLEARKIHDRGFLV